MKTIEINGKKHKVKDEIADHIQWLEVRLKVKHSVGKKYGGNIENDIDDIYKKLSDIKDKVDKMNEEI